MAEQQDINIWDILQRARMPHLTDERESLTRWTQYFQRLGIRNRPQILAVLAAYGHWKDGNPLRYVPDRELLHIPNFGKLSLKEVRKVFPLSVRNENQIHSSLRQEPFAVLGDEIRVDVNGENEGINPIKDIMVTISWKDTGEGIIIWGDEIIQLHAALGDIIKGDIDFSLRDDAP